MSRTFKREFLPNTQATIASFFSLNRSEISLITSQSLGIFPSDLHCLRYQYSNAILAHVQASARGLTVCLLKKSAHSYGHFCEPTKQLLTSVKQLISYLWQQCGTLLSVHASVCWYPSAYMAATTLWVMCIWVVHQCSQWYPPNTVSYILKPI